MIKKINCESFKRISDYEKTFGLTIDRKLDVYEKAASGEVYPSVIANPELARLSQLKEYNQPIFLDEWVLPSGAFGESDGPV